MDQENDRSFERLDGIDNALINYLLLVGIGFGFLVLLSSMYLRDWAWPAYRYFQVLGIAGASLLYYFRNRYSARFKVNVIILLIEILAINGLFSGGLRASVSLLLICISLCSQLAYSKRNSHFIFFGCVLLYFSVGVIRSIWFIPELQYGLPVLIPHTMLLMAVGLLIQLYTSTYIQSLKGLVESANHQNQVLFEHKQELEKTKTILESAIAHSPSGIMIADAGSSSVSMANQAAFFVHGDNQSQLLKGIDAQTYVRQWEVLHTNGTRYRSSELPLYRALMHGEYIKGEELVIRVPNSQKEHWISANAAPIKDAENNINSAIVLFHDITEIKRAQLDLEHLIAERTEKLEISNKQLQLQKAALERSLTELQETQTQLVRAEKMASLSVLVAGVSHEINNPLNFVQGGVIGINQYLEEQPEKEQLHDIQPFIESIEVGVQRAARIVKSLNHVFRQRPDQHEPCDLHEVLENCLLVLHNKIKNRITVERHYTPEDLQSMGNEGEFHQMFMNILTNAEQAISGNEGTISLHTRKEDDFAMVTINDSGTGISKDHLRKVGDPFFTTRDPGEGVGLGLYVVNNILEKHRGGWEVDSSIDKGTQISIRLPLV